MRTSVMTALVISITYPLIALAQSPKVTITTNSSGIITIKGIRLKQPVQASPLQSGTSIKPQAIDVKPLQTQRRSAEMRAISDDELAQQRAEYNACKEFVGAAQQGAYDGRWSQSMPGQLIGAGKAIKASKTGEQCPPELLESRPISEWQRK